MTQLTLPLPPQPRPKRAREPTPRAPAPRGADKYDDHVFTGEGCEPQENVVIPEWLKIRGLDYD